MEDEGCVSFTPCPLSLVVYHLNKQGRFEPVVLFSATNFSNFPFLFVLIRGGSL